MNAIYFSEYSIGRLTVMLLSFVVVAYLLLRKSKSRSTKWLMISFISIFLFSLGYFTAYSIFSPISSWGWYITSIGSFGPIALIQFAYRFPSYHYIKESRIVLYISSAIFILALIDYFFFALGSPVISTSTHFGSTYASRYLPAYWVLANIWMVILCLRQSGRIGNEKASVQGKAFSPLRIFFPTERPARAARNFALLIMLELTLSLSTTLFMSLNVTSLSTFNMISSGGMLIICTMYIVVYLNNATETNTFMIKLTGISMATVFLIIGGMSSLVMSNYDNAYTEIRSAQLPHIGDLLGKEGAVYPDDVTFIIAGENNSFDNAAIKYSRDQSFNIPEPLRLWEKPPSIRILTKSKIKGSRIFDDKGKLRQIRYFTQINGLNYYCFTFQKDNILYGAGYDFIQYRKYMHEKASWLVLIVSAVSLLFLIIYPALFYTGLVIPLNNLLAGVRKVDEGNLEINIPIQFRDEIGYLSGLFNRMVLSIKDKNKSLDDYAANLEIKVAERTSELENERQLLSEKNRIIENDLLLAKKIQLGLIPTSCLVPYVSFMYQPMEQVGGDFYDFIYFRDPDLIGIFICDVSGHGVHAAFITSMIKTAILQSGRRKDNPAVMLGYINDLLQKQTAENFITAFYCIFNRENKKLLYSNAGHPLPYTVSGDGISQLEKGNNPALAIFSNDFLATSGKAYTNHETILNADSKLLLYTDGMTEARPGECGSYFEDDKMTDIFIENRNLSSSLFISKVYEALIEFCGEESFEDDICIICLEVK